MITRDAVMARPLLVALLALTACAQEIVAHLQEERDANRMLVLLGRDGVEAEKMRDEKSRELRFNVLVAKADKQSALTVLERYNLPDQKKDGTSEMFKEGGMIPTATQERAKREVGVKGDIENGLMKLDRVIEVGALVSIPEDDPLRDVNEARPKPKASVLVTYLPDADNRPPITVEDVQRFVQASLPELKSTEVAVQLIPQRGGKGLMATSGASADPSAPAAAIPTNGCEREMVVGIDLCVGQKKKLINGIIVFTVIASVLSVMAVVAVLRALRYRKDLTRLTQQVAQIRR